MSSAQLESLAPFIEQELRQLARAGAKSPAAALQEICRALYGEACPSRERRQFFLFAAPLARRIAIERGLLDPSIAPGVLNGSAIVKYLGELSSEDPIVLRIVDLYGFTGLSLEEIAEVIEMPVSSVVQKLAELAWLARRTRDTK